MRYLAIITATLLLVAAGCTTLQAQSSEADDTWTLRGDTYYETGDYQ